MSSLQRRLFALVQNPRESLDVEIKDWLDIREKEHQADLVKAILALANHGGGYVIIGFREEAGLYQPTQPDVAVNSLYNQDKINGIVARYTEPKIHVECQHVTVQHGSYPVIIVHGGHLVPVRCTRSQGKIMNNISNWEKS